MRLRKTFVLETMLILSLIFLVKARVVIEIDNENNNMASNYSYYEASEFITTNAALPGTNYGLNLRFKDIAVPGPEQTPANLDIGTSSMVYVNANFNAIGQTDASCRFYFNVDNVVMPTGAYFTILSIGNMKDWFDNCRIEVKNINGMQIRAAIYPQGVWSNLISLSGGWHFAEVSIKRATSKASKDASFKFWLDGNLVFTTTGIDLYTEWPANILYIGHCSKYDAVTSWGGNAVTGNLYVDEVIYRDDDSYIGSKNELDNTNPTVTTTPITKSWPGGSTQNINWMCSDNIGVVRCSVYTRNFEYNPWTIRGGNSGGASGSIPLTISANSFGVTQIKITAWDARNNSTNAEFAVTISDTIFPIVALTNPKGDGTERWACGSKQPINWLASDNIDIGGIAIYYGYKKDVLIKYDSVIGNLGTKDFTVPNDSMGGTPLWIKLIAYDLSNNATQINITNPITITKDPYITSANLCSLKLGKILDYNITYNPAGHNGSPVFAILESPKWIGIIANKLVGNANIKGTNIVKIEMTLDGIRVVKDIAIEVLDTTNTSIKYISNNYENKFSTSSNILNNIVRFNINAVEVGLYNINIYRINGQRVFNKAFIVNKSGLYNLDWENQNIGMVKGAYFYIVKNSKKEIYGKFIIVR